MRHKVGDVVLVPMIVGAPDGDGYTFVSFPDGAIGVSVPDEELDAYAAAPHAPKVGDWVRRLNGGRVTGARAAAAAALRVPIATYNGWRAGRQPANEATVRRLMQLTPF